MKRFAALALAVMCLLSSCAYAAEDYTVAEKLVKQLWAGSGFSGTLTVSFETPSLSTKTPIVLDLDYIYVRPTEEETSEHRVDLILMDGENARSAAYAQYKDEELSIQADVISPDWYLFTQPDGAEESSAVQTELESGASALYAATGMPALSETALTFAAALMGAEGLEEAIEPYKTRLDIWIEAYRQDTVLDKLPDGTTTMSVRYAASPAAIKSQLKQLVMDVLADQDLVSILTDAMGEETARLYLNPRLQSWYFKVIDSMPLDGDLTLSRTVSLKGDTLNLHLNLPLHDASAGSAVLCYDRTQGQGDLPDNHTVTLSSSQQLITLSYQEYSSMTGVEVTQGMVMCEQLDSFAVGESETAPQDWAVAFTLKQQETTTVDADGREVYGYDFNLLLQPDETLDNTFALTETEIDLTSRFMSRPLKSASTEMDATFSVKDETSSLTLRFNGASRKLWKPEEIPAGRVNVHELTQEDLASILPGAAIRLMAALSDMLEMPAQEP